MTEKSAKTFLTASLISNSLTDSLLLLVHLTDVTLAIEYAQSKLVDDVAFADVDDEES